MPGQSCSSTAASSSGHPGRGNNPTPSQLCSLSTTAVLTKSVDWPLVQCLSNSLTERTILLMLRRYRVGGSGGTQQDRIGRRGEPRVGAADPRDDGGRARPAA